MGKQITVNDLSPAFVQLQLELLRTYFPSGTNGDLYLNQNLLCHTIELPWKDNEVRKSCVPEGRYELIRRYNKKFQHHLLLKSVPGRSMILVHPANDAIKELKGCIAPVTTLTAPGRGNASRVACEVLKEVVFPALEKGRVFIKIQSKNNDNQTKNRSANAGLL